MPGVKPVSVVLVPEPAVNVPPGLRVIVQVPEPGKPFNITLPIVVQDGCVMAPTTGVVGEPEGTIMFADTGETHPAELVTVYL